MARAKSAATPPPAVRPVQPIEGAADWERRDWLPAESGVEFIEALQKRHLDAVSAAGSTPPAPRL